MFLDYFGYYLYNAITIFVIYLIIFKRDFVIKHKKEVIIAIITLLLYSQFRRYGARLFTPSFHYTIENIPLHFCRMSALMTALYLITKNKIVKGFVYFQAGLGVFSVLIPGGYFFIMTQDWRSYTYMVDHFVLAIMPFFLVFIEDYKVNKRDLTISLIYSNVMPIVVLPLALHTNYNAYYVLDGVFAKDIVGDNQFLIIVLMLFGLTLYNFLMYYVGQKLEKWSQKTYETSDQLFTPKWPWIAISSFIVVGVIIGIFFVRPVPIYLPEITQEYQAKPVVVQGIEYVVYKGLGDDGELYYFIEPLHADMIKVFDQHGYRILTTETNYNTVYFDAQDVSTDQIVMILYTNYGEDTETIKTFTLTIDRTKEEFWDCLFCTK